MTDPRLRSSWLAAVALALTACAAPSTPSPASPPDGEAEHHDASEMEDPGEPPSAPGSHKDAGASNRDASIDGMPGDTGGTGSGSGSGSGSIPGGSVSCYTTGSPSTACTLPVHCCFANYSSQHDGTCTSASCTWGTIDCDGPEDCPSGQRCCSHVLVDPEFGITGYKLACQATACGQAPANHELCHPASSAAGTCSTSAATCVSALGADSDLPPSLHICE